jgi:hypothetical protein
MPSGPQVGQQRASKKRHTFGRDNIDYLKRITNAPLLAQVLRPLYLLVVATAQVMRLLGDTHTVHKLPSGRVVQLSGEAVEHPLEQGIPTDNYLRSAKHLKLSAIRIQP